MLFLYSPFNSLAEWMCRFYYTGGSCGCLNGDISLNLLSYKHVNSPKQEQCICTKIGHTNEESHQIIVGVIYQQANFLININKNN